MAYSPTSAGSSTDVLQYVLKELDKVSQALQLIEDGGAFPVRYVGPKRPRIGRLYYADGTSWNPGSGQGLYRYNGSAYVFVG